MKLQKQEKSNLLQKLRNIVKPDIGNEENPSKHHNDIEIGPGGNTAAIGINENLRIIIREMIEDVMSEYYPQSFSFDEFKDISSYAGKLKYADRNLQKIKSGSGRTAYKVDDEKVLKVAKNEKGLAQNREESEGHKQNYDIIAKVFEVDNDDYWVEMELAKKLTPNRFKEITGISIKDLSLYFFYLRMNQINSRNSYGEKIENFENTYEDNDFFNSLKEFVFDYDFHTGDLGRISSYGEVSRDGSPKVVLIDFGLSKSVYDDYYKPKPKRSSYPMYRGY